MQSETTERTIITESTQEGWSWHPVWEYERKEQGSSILRRSFDIVSCSDKSKELTVVAACMDLGLLSAYTISCIDWARKETVAVKSIERSKGKRNTSLSPAEDSSLTYFNQSMTISILRRGAKHRVLITAPSLALPSGEIGLKADITLHHSSSDECFSSLATEKERKSFTYITKYTPMKAEGVLFTGDSISRFSDESFGSVTWTRHRGNIKRRILEVSVNTENQAVFISDSSDMHNAAFCNGTYIKLGHCEIKRIAQSFVIDEENGMCHLTLTPVAQLRMREDLRPIKGEIVEIWAKAEGTIALNGQKSYITDAYSSIRIAASSL